MSIANKQTLTREAFNLLRKCFPEIPEHCDWIKINMDKVSAPYVQCGFYPTKTEEIEK